MKMLAECSMTSRSSAFIAARPLAIRPFSSRTSNSRPQLQVLASKGKQRMRTGGGRMSQTAMPQIPTPPVDPDNVEFVIFVRSKKLLSWMPLSVMKGGGPANMLVKSLETDIGKNLYGNALVENIGKAIYKDQAGIERAIRGQFPMLKTAKEFEFGFKIRDKENPKNWFMATPDIQVIPPEAELGTTPIDNINKMANEAGSFFQNIGKNLGIGQAAQQ